MSAQEQNKQENELSLAEWEQTLPDVYDKPDKKYLEGQNRRNDQYYYDERSLQFLKAFLEKVKQVEETPCFQQKMHQLKVPNGDKWFHGNFGYQIFFTEKKISESDKVPDRVDVEWVEARRLETYYLDGGHLPTAAFYSFINTLHDHYCKK